MTTDQKNKENFYKLDEGIIHEDIAINYLENKGNFFKKIFSYLRKQKNHKDKLRILIEKYNPDIIISLGGADKYILPSIKGNTKLVLEHHFERYYLFKQSKNLLYKCKDFIFLKGEDKLLKQYDEFLVLTEEDKKQYKSEKVKVINNPLSLYTKEISELSNKKVISVGRLTLQKGYDLLIEAWKNVAKKYPNWTSEIYGESELKNELQEKINNYGLEKNIQLVLLEAQACGLQIVSFDCPCGPKEDIIINHENGFLCKFGDIN